MGSQADVMLQSAITFREAEVRDSVVPNEFASVDEAIDTWINVILHEAHSGMMEPLPVRPERPYLHPVDVDTEDPGIVDDSTRLHIRRRQATEIPRLNYRQPMRVVEEPPEELRVVARTERAARKLALKGNERNIARAEKIATTTERREQRRLEKKEALRLETEEQRASRLQAQREKRAARSERPPREDITGIVGRKKPKSAEACIQPDSSNRILATRPAAKRSRGPERYYEHPLPNHRFLQCLHRCRPNKLLEAALLRGEESEYLEIIQGPPGTGKTKALVDRIRQIDGRVFACAPTNVGAANLYERCVSEGLGDECALLLAPERVPPGVPVMSNDPSRRIVCATISGRGGRYVDEQEFGAVVVDEAAQCMEACVWSLLRNEVTTLVLAGDVKQLPALVSEGGRQYAHDRSLMERLMNVNYDNVISLTVQNRMAPELLRFPNTLYGNTLRCGPHAPTSGSVEVHVLANGTEVADGTSWRNPDEIEAICHMGIPSGAIVICPYVAQCRALLSKGKSWDVHTIDSFQGREADTVVLSVVRDGRNGLGFWEDVRRVSVACTRARTRFVVVASRVTEWPPHILRDWLLDDHHRG